MTRMIPGFKHMPYEDRLSKFGLSALQQRHLTGTSLKFLKIINKFEDVNSWNLFHLPDDGQGNLCTF